MAEFIDWANLAVNSSNNAQLSMLVAAQASAQRDEMLFSMVVDQYANGKEQAKARQSFLAFTCYSQARMVYTQAYPLINRGDTKLKMTELLDKIDAQLSNLLREDDSRTALVSELASVLRLSDAQVKKLLADAKATLEAQGQRLKEAKKSRHLVAQEVIEVLRTAIPSDVADLERQVLMLADNRNPERQKSLGPHWGECEAVFCQAEAAAGVSSDWGPKSLKAIDHLKTEVQQASAQASQIIDCRLGNISGGVVAGIALIGAMFLAFHVALAQRRDSVPSIASRAKAKNVQAVQPGKKRHKAKADKRGPSTAQKNAAQCCAEVGGSWRWSTDTEIFYSYSGDQTYDEQCQAKYGCCNGADWPYNWESVPSCRAARDNGCSGLFRCSSP